MMKWRVIIVCLTDGQWHGCYKGHNVWHHGSVQEGCCFISVREEVQQENNGGTCGGIWSQLEYGVQHFGIIFSPG
ncbi:hypothetical protein E1A91_A02G055400v1 [Gossypium mustelinum]|uniref:Uncharacterized protein n=3 Tax=Gossypium TaxID=3633 RepID=A0A5J5WJL6_GOSBA|nr:hypothetical protein ES319_A02G052300v1 [Gossypium barbadense]KAB2092768.1 hypothetical protein ES319_A02G052300v1 [Gossypium barbadense]TYH27302.1 hypothetical protein ES288_A02G058700v1 [Gossypium darwinii]TYJ45437.1 hypothetical protein E1A91_A02G055400v1 [Gossypium mustelinum]